MLILDGKSVAAKIRANIEHEIAEAMSKGIRPPALAVIRVGDDHASRIYVRNKERACKEAGMRFEHYNLPADTGIETLTGLIGDLNRRGDMDGILTQLPLPPFLDASKCILTIDPTKDVDGFHPLNVGRMALGQAAFQPCTPAGVMALLKFYGLSTVGKNAVVVGRSDIVGKPLARLLSSKAGNATVTLCHSGTRDLKNVCRNADFLFVAVGKPRFIGADMVKDGCVVVDIGINRDENGICGDVDFENVSKKAAALTPVPGGIGPMTIAMLLRNTLLAWREHTQACALEPRE